MLENNKYEFVLEAQTMLSIGSNEQGKLLVTSDAEYFIPGNSLGGALRDYLNQLKWPKEAIWRIMGGEDKPPKVKQEKSFEDKQMISFIESKMFISHGQLKPDKGQKDIKKIIKTGVAINPAYKTARNNHKYELEVLEPKFTLIFTIECEVNSAEEASNGDYSLEKMIYAWFQGINNGEIRFGGKKSNNFGRFIVKELSKQVNRWDSSIALEQFVFSKSPQPSSEKLHEKWAQNRATIRKLHFDIKGSFPYGLYQAFKNEEQEQQVIFEQEAKALTGPLKKADGQGFYMPSTTLKGILRGEFRKLLQRMLADVSTSLTSELLDRMEAQLFGDKEYPGKVIVADMELKQAEYVKIARPKETISSASLTDVYTQIKSDPKQLGDPVYIKIDRLTGSVLGSSLKHQQEISGDAHWSFSLKKNETGDEAPFVFPLLYIIGRIAKGKVPIGGRTAVGLGEFIVKEINFIDQDGQCERIEVQSQSDKQQEAMKVYFKQFQDWITEHKKGLRERGEDTNVTRH